MAHLMWRNHGALDQGLLGRERVGNSKGQTGTRSRVDQAGSAQRKHS